MMSSCENRALGSVEYVSQHSPAIVHAQLWGPWELFEDDGTTLRLKLMAVELIVFLSLNLTCD